MEKRELIDMFKNKIFPKQAEDLLRMNYEGLGELDKWEFLRDTSILIMLAEKGLKTEQEIVKPYLDKIREEIINEKAFAYADFERYKEEVLGVEPDELPDDDFRFGMERAIEIIDKYKA